MVRLPMLMRCWAMRALGAFRGWEALVLPGVACAARVALLMGGLYASDADNARVGCAVACEKPRAGCQNDVGDPCTPGGKLGTIRSVEAAAA